MVLRNPIRLVALAGLLHSSFAGAVDDWYAAFAVGSDYADKVKFADSGLRAELDRGFPVGGGAIGARVGARLYAELEGMYRVNDFEVLYSSDSAVEINPDPADAISSTSVMANLWYEFLPASGMRPFLGAGLGWARIDVEASNEVTGERLVDDRAGALAYQLIAGFTFDVSPRVDLSVSYRLWRTESFEFETTAGLDEKSRQTVHSTLLGMRYHFSPRNFEQRAPSSAPADHRGFYVAASAGAGFAKDAEIKDDLANFDAFGPGPFAAVAAGFGWKRGWRLELEASARRNDAQLIDFNPEFGEGRANGDIRMRSLMANVYYDFSRFRGFRPHVGAGIGKTRGTYDVGVRGGTFVDDEDTATAVQLLLGATTQISERMAISVGYRVWMGLGFEMEQPDGKLLETDQLVHTLEAGLRFSLR